MNNGKAFLEPPINRLLKEDIAKFPRVKSISLDSYISYTEQVKPGSMKSIDRVFLEWFIGFAEGDGCFTQRYVQDNRVKNKIPAKQTRLSFEINQKDFRLIHLIKKKLGFGQVSYNKKPSQKTLTYAKFVVQDQASIKQIMHLFNGNFCFPKRCSQFVYWVEFGKRLQPPNFVLKKQILDVSLQNAWLTGVIEAEGSFYASYRDKSSTYVNPKVVKFGLKQKMSITQQDTHGESEILEKIALLFVTRAQVYKVKEPNCFRIEVGSLESHHRIIKYLTEFALFGKKRLAAFRSYRIFLIREMIIQKKLILDTSDSAVQKMQKLCKKVNEQAEQKI